MNRRSLYSGSIFIAIAAVAAALFIYFRTPLENYRESRIQRGSVSTGMVTIGIVQPQSRVDIKPTLPGRIEKVLVKEGDLVKRGQVLLVVSSVERAALLDSVGDLSKEEMARLDKTNGPTTMTAPLDGTVIQRLVSPGQTYAADDVLIVIADRLIIEAQVPETDVPVVKVDQDVELILDSYPDDVIPGRVDRLAFEAKTVGTVTTYTSHVLPTRVPEYMRAGMTTNLKFVTQRRDDVLTLPNDFLRSLDGETLVRVRKPDGRVLDVPVKTGITDGKISEVLSGVEVGDVALIENVKRKKSSGVRR